MNYTAVEIQKHCRSARQIMTRNQKKQTSNRLDNATSVQNIDKQLTNCFGDSPLRICSSTARRDITICQFSNQHFVSIKRDKNMQSNIHLIEENDKGEYCKLLTVVRVLVKTLSL